MAIAEGPAGARIEVVAVRGIEVWRQGPRWMWEVKRWGRRGAKTLASGEADSEAVAHAAARRAWLRTNPWLLAAGGAAAGLIAAAAVALVVLLDKRWR